MYSCCFGSETVIIPPQFNLHSNGIENDIKLKDFMDAEEIWGSECSLFEIEILGLKFIFL